MIVTLGQPIKAAWAATEVARVARRRARRGGEAEATSTREGYRHDTVLERARRIARVILQPQFTHAELFGQSRTAPEAVSQPAPRSTAPFRGRVAAPRSARSTWGRLNRRSRHGSTRGIEVVVNLQWTKQFSQE